MEKAPKSLRLHIGLFGRTNVGKSSFLNMIFSQAVAITSALPGTTTRCSVKGDGVTSFRPSGVFRYCWFR